MAIGHWVYTFDDDTCKTLVLVDNKKGIQMMCQNPGVLGRYNSQTDSS